MREIFDRSPGIYDGDGNYIEDVRNEVYSIVQKFAKEGSGHALRAQDLRNHSLLLYLASDKLISELHENFLLKEPISGYFCSSEVVFSPTMVDILEQTSYQKDNDLKVDGTKIKLNLPNNEPLEFSSLIFRGHDSYPLLFVVALLNNAVINGDATDATPHRVEVGVSVDPEYLVLSNLVYVQDISIREPGNKVVLNAIKYYYDQMASSDERVKTTFSYSYEPLPGVPHLYSFVAKLPRING
jgi:hypothetical protein